MFLCLVRGGVWDWVNMLVIYVLGEEEKWVRLGCERRFLFTVSDLRVNEVFEKADLVSRRVWKGLEKGLRRF